VHTPIVRTMIEASQYPVIGINDIEDFTATHRFAVLFFTELMKPVPETADVAVILPELERAFSGRFAVAVVAWEAQRELQRRFRFSKYPSLVFLREGEYLGAISGVLDWTDYLAEVAAILEAEPSEPPPFAFPGQGPSPTLSTEQAS
jgi:hydrogenase-1 operon protein HyaE